MKVTAEPAARSTVVLEVELPADRLQRSIDDAVRHLGRRTKVPGFRPGKVPRPMLERALGVRRDAPDGRDPIYDDAKEHLFESTVAEALEQSDLDALGIPSPEWTRFVEGEGAAYRIVLPVRPDVKLGAYVDYPFGADIETIDAARIDQVLEQLREQHASLVPVEDRGAEQGDYAVISFEGRRDGVPFDGGKADRFPLRIGSERMIPGFEAALVGMRDGEERTFTVTFPDDYGEAALAGKLVEFTATLLELRRQELPPLDDDFAGSMGDFAGLDALRDDIRTRLEQNARDRARHMFADRIIEFAVANATLVVPDLLVEREVEVMHDELKVRLAEQGIDEATYLKVTGKDEAQLHTEWREPAEHRVKVMLVLSAVADAESVTIPDADVEAEVERARLRNPANPKLVGYLGSARGRAYLRSTLRRSRVVEALVDRWLLAHPEVGPLPHLEDDSPAAPSAELTITEGSPA